MRDSLRWSILNTLVILCFTVLIVAVVYFLDLWFLGVYKENYGTLPLVGKWTDLFLLQGAMLIIIGFIPLLGRMKEMRNIEIWVPNGYPRLGLTLIYSGAIMILIYFLNL